MRRRLFDLVRSGRHRGSQPIPASAAVAAADAPDELGPTIEPSERMILERCDAHTMTSPPRLLALLDAVKYVTRRRIPGAFVECGVWRGGSVLAMILTLQELGVEDRDIHLYDTFEGMTEPTANDTSAFDPPALESWEKARAEGTRAWSEVFSAQVFDEDSVRATLVATGYPERHLHFHAGDVTQTLPGQAPPGLALLRLDTDWYESTLHELRHLYPRLLEGGVLIIDDYGHWQGSRLAVDEYFGERMPLLNRIDYTGRIAVKDGGSVEPT